MSDPEHVNRTAEIVKSNPLRRYVVVSAPGRSSGSDLGITDMLYICHSKFFGGENYAEILAAIYDCYNSIVQGLGINFNIDDAMSSLKDDLSSGKSVDYFASRGEYIMAGIFAAYLGWELIDAAEIIRFKADGTLDKELSLSTAGKILLNTNHAVIPGFYGSMPDGSIKTFKRGAGDITGGIAARSVDAEMFEKWNRDREIFSADPNIVSNPEIIRTLSYREALELNYVGIKTTQDEVIMLLNEAGIPMNIRSISAPDDIGTIISAEIPEGSRHNVAVCIAGRRNFSIIHIGKYGVNGEAGFGERLFNVFSKHRIACEHCLSGIYRLSVVLKSPVFDLRRSAVLDEIKSAVNTEDVTVEKNLSLIAIIGQGMGTVHGTFMQAFTALAGEKIKVRMTDQGSDNMNIILGVHDEDYNMAINALYKAMIINH